MERMLFLGWRAFYVYVVYINYSGHAISIEIASFQECH